MTWTRITDNHFQRREAFEVSDRARLLEVAALVWSNQAGEDGAIPRRALKALSSISDQDAAPVEEYAAELVAVGLWDVTETGWQVRGWADLQPTAAQVAERKRKHAETQQRSARRSELHRAGDHSECTSWCPSRRSAGAGPDGVTEVSSDMSVRASLRPPRPDPTRPGPKGKGREEEGSATARADGPDGPPASLRTPRGGGAAQSAPAGAAATGPAPGLRPGQGAAAGAATPRGGRVVAVVHGRGGAD